MFLDRADAGRRLAARLAEWKLTDPLVLGVPRGGVVVAAALADALGAELDVALARKLRAPFQPELALGAVGEDGAAHVNERLRRALGVSDEYLAVEHARQRDELAQRRALYRAARAPARRAGRSVIVTDDGVATGATLFAALEAARRDAPLELIAAVPVAPAERLEQARGLCDRLVCLLAPADFQAVGQFYHDFDQVDDAEVTRLLRQPNSPENAASR